MSATLQRPAPPAPSGAPQPQHAAPASPAIDVRELVTLAATICVLIAACLPLARVFVGLEFLRPVLAAVVLSVGLSWGARRLGAGPVIALLVTIAGWVVFVSTAFLGDTLVAGILPSAETFRAGASLWARGIQLVQLRPAPTFAEAGLLLLTVTGVWAIAHAVEGAVFRLRAPLQASALALILWTVPLALAPPGGRAWQWAVPFLGSVALLLLSFVGSDIARYAGADPSTRAVLYPTGTVVAAVAIITGVFAATMLPGFGDKPWYQMRGMGGGTTLTTNPIVDIRARLVAGNTGPVLRVSTPRPLYLRVTSLDSYSANEEWTNSGIQGSPMTGPVPLDVPVGSRETVGLSVTVENLPKAVLVPAPYQVTQVDGEVSESFQYDRRNATLTLDTGSTLTAGDRYGVVASIPAPTVEELASVSDVLPNPAYTQLPDNVPGAVAELAQSIVDEAGAQTPFDQALAIQTELRSWKYSTEPPQGHGARAMEQFLESRTGYCEQYAGTMAVMLRTLGIPARVAVGYTPGELEQPDANGRSDTYVITNANAHAWVEVLFPNMGWIAFEPTPRDDGNVLVPTATNLAPERTVRQRAGEQGEATAPVPEERLPRTPADQQTEEATPAPVPGEAGSGGGSTTGLPWGVLLSLLGAAAVIGGVAYTRRRDPHELVPSDQVLRARERVERIGRGFGVVPTRSDTDLEYLSRVAAVRGGEAHGAARRLAEAVASARYSPTMPARAVDDATAAADSLVQMLLSDLSTPRRLWAKVRAPFAGVTPHVRRAGLWLGHAVQSVRGLRSR